MNNGYVIKNLRLQMGLTQSQLASLIGCKQNTLSQYEHGLASPSIKLAKEIVRAAKDKKIKIKLEDIFPDDN
jgi:transcriptional regulator with XRE-family HTH domain